MKFFAKLFKRVQDRPVTGVVYITLDDNPVAQVTFTTKPEELDAQMRRICSNMKAIENGFSTIEHTGRAFIEADARSSADIAQLVDLVDDIVYNSHGVPA